MRVAPAAIMSCTSSAVRIPPAALTPILGTDRLAHQRDVEDGGAALRVAGRGLDHVRLGLLREAAGDDLLLVGEEGGLDDHLVGDAGLVAGVRDARDVLADEVVGMPLLRAPMLMTMSISRAPSRMARRVSKALTSVGRGPEREADHRRDGDVRAAQALRAAADPGRVDADGGEAVLGGLVAELVDVGGRGVGLAAGCGRCSGRGRAGRRRPGPWYSTREAPPATMSRTLVAHWAAQPRRHVAQESAAVPGAAPDAEGGEHLAGDRLDEVRSLVDGVGHRGSSPGPASAV